MRDQHDAVDGGPPLDVTDEGVDQRRAVVGGLTVLGTILGFTLVRAVVEGGGIPDEWVLAALPAFGVVGLVGFVVFLSAVVHD